jgi:uncharacterized protein (TIGR02453 family)
MVDLSPILTFLSKLTKSNNREWFEKNKAAYVQAKENFELFVSDFLHELVQFNPALAGLDAKKLTFRIYRDVRFTKDKRPYKTNMGAGFSRNGKLVQEPGYYLHIEPGNKSFIAGGMYMPDAERLHKIRQEIDYNTDRFQKMLADKKFKKWFPALDDFDKLKTAPKGYAKDLPHIELLKHKSYIVSHPFTDAEVKDKKFLKKIAEAAKAMKPLNDFLQEAIA